MTEFFRPIATISNNGWRGVTPATLRNLLTYTENFDEFGSTWSVAFSTLSANAALAPNLTFTAEKLVEDTHTSFHYLNCSATIPTSTDVTFSLYAKPAGRNNVELNIGGALTHYARFDVSGGSLISSSNASATSITSAGNGWYRIAMVFQDATALNTVLIAIQDTSAFYLGDGSSGLYIWGAQLEVASSVTAYQPVYSSTYGEYETLRNLLTYTEAFDNAVWSDLGLSSASWSANASTDPYGRTGSDKLVESTGNVEHHSFASLHLAASTDYVFSVYCKPAGRDWVLFQVDLLSGASAPGAWFNFSTGVVGTTFNSPTTTIAPATNGFYRATFGFNSSSGGSNPVLHFVLANADNVFTYNGDGSSGVYFWGAQLNSGTSVSNYQHIIATLPPPTGTLSYALVGNLDESSADDTDFILARSNGLTCKLQLTRPADFVPVSKTGHTLRVRAYSYEGEKLTINLYCGATSIYSASAQALTAIPTTYSFGLSESAVESITDYSNLRVWLTTVVGSYAPLAFDVRVTWVELETPSGTVKPKIMYHPLSFSV